VKLPDGAEEGGGSAGSGAALRVRRVVTGHDAQQRAVIVSDDSLPITTRRPGQQGCVVWAADRLPEDNLAPVDGAQRASGTVLPGGVVLRVLRYEPGISGRMHRTQSTDYGIVLSGCIVLQLEDGVEVTLNAGDTVVQRGTIHNWINRGAEPCTIAFVLVDAQPIFQKI
jgi:quercetin dioxygenase-like cupin family protein